MSRYKKDNKVKKKFDELVNQKKRGNLLKRCFHAFWVGGSICLCGEIIKNIMIYFGTSNEVASVALPIIMIFIGAFLTGIGVYDKIASFAGAGTLVPITGFANAMVSAAMEHKSEGYIIGISSNMFKIAGPVLVFGVLESFILGIIYYLLCAFEVII